MEEKVEYINSNLESLENIQADVVFLNPPSLKYPSENFYNNF